jgi:dCTP deaminase
MIEPDFTLQNWAIRGGIDGDFNDAQIGPCSIDLRLGNEIRVPHAIWDTMTEDEMWRHFLNDTLDTLPHWTDPIIFEKWLLLPHRFVLLSSLEFVNLPRDMVALLALRSSAGRMGMDHAHSGLGEPGWCGQWTWEIFNVAPWPVVLQAGECYVQQVMIRMSREPYEDYGERQRSKYQHQTGPTPALPPKDN